MTHITIGINCENSAFRDSGNSELGRILRDLADKLEDYETPERLKDINGNIVGIVEYL